ncbi:MAG: type III pantothenate kinase [Balneolales bacterium]
MKKTLYLDAGNTRVKAAVYEQGQWLPAGEDAGAIPYDTPDFAERLSVICRGYDRVVFASVKKSLGPKELSRITDATVIPVERSAIPGGRIRYRSMETFGVDRYLSCLGAWSLSRTEVIVADAGTACTIDVMDADAVYLGGVIMPGLYMMISSIGEGADGLYPVAPYASGSRAMQQQKTGTPGAGSRKSESRPFLPGSGAPRIQENWPPDTTEAALQAGTTGTFLAAWESHVRTTMDRFPDARIWLTGGEAHFIYEHTSVNCRIHEYLVFEGMRRWCEENLRIFS